MWLVCEEALTSSSPQLPSSPDLGSLANNSLGPDCTLGEALEGKRGMAAFLSEEEDSADSSTDSDKESALTNAFASILPTATGVSPAPPAAMGAPVSSPDVKVTDAPRNAFLSDENNDL